MMITYTGTAQLEGEWWAICVNVGDQEVWTQSAYPDSIDSMARSAVAIALDASEDSFELDVCLIV